MNLLLKTMWGETEGFILLFWNALFVSGSMMRWKGWKGGKGGRVVRWVGGCFLVSFKGGENKVSSRFHLFVSDVN